MRPWICMAVWCTALTLMVAGCATGFIPPEVGRQPATEESQAIKTFLPDVITAARQEGFTCATVPVVMADMPNDAVRTTARPSSNPCLFYLQLNPLAIRQDSPRHDSPLELAGEAAHELGHVMNRDWTPERASVPQIVRERQADAVAIRILNRLGSAYCQARIDLYKKIRAANIRAWGVEQRTTVTTHPSYTERIQTLEKGWRA